MYKFRSGTGVTIRELVRVVVNNIKPKPEVQFDASKPSGDQKRVLDISKARALGFEPEISIEQGIKETMEWYIANQGKTNKDMTSLIKNGRKAQLT